MICEDIFVCVCIVKVIFLLTLQLLESVQGVQEAIGSNQAEEQPPLPPYPNLTDLSISGKKHFIIVEHLFCHGLKLLSKNYSLVFNTSHGFFLNCDRVSFCMVITLLIFNRS